MLERRLQALMPLFIKFSNFKVIKSLKNGFVRIVPFTLIGSIILLIMYFPLDGYSEFMASVFGENWLDPLSKLTSATYDILAILATFSIAYEYCKEEGIDGVSPGLFAISGLFIMTSNFVTSGSGEIVASAAPLAWFGGKGLISALISGLISGFIYTWFIKRDIRIKLPESVPPAVANSFSALIPGAVILATFGVLHVLSNIFTNSSVTETIYLWLQIPLQNLTDTLPGIIVVSIVISVFWWCGIHGDAIVTSGILSPVLISNMLSNQEVVEAGGTLVAGENAKIITEQFTLFMKMGGAGVTIGLIISMFFFGKSKQMKQLAKLGLGPSLFNINEPLIFGTPVMFNPIMFVPFLLAPTANVIIGYLAISTGIIEPFAGITVPWTLPPVLSGFIIGGWKLALLQLGLIFLSVLIYLPFFKVHDRILLEKEREEEAEEAEQMSDKNIKEATYE